MTLISTANNIGNADGYSKLTFKGFFIIAKAVSRWYIISPITRGDRCITAADEEMLNMTKPDKKRSSFTEIFLALYINLRLCKIDSMNRNASILGMMKPNIPKSRQIL
jgi:hypothetical protein